MPPASPPLQPPTPEWPTDVWFPPAPRPRLKVNWVVLVGAICVFFGYLLVVISDLLFIRMPQQVSYSEYVMVASIAIAGTTITGTGFLIALVGLAIHR